MSLFHLHALIGLELNVNFNTFNGYMGRRRRIGVNTDAIPTVLRLRRPDSTSGSVYDPQSKGSGLRIFEAPILIGLL